MMEIEKIRISEESLELEGSLAIPEDSKGIVIFAHGSGSSRFSPRNQQVAAFLNSAGLGTLLFDLLAPEEAADRGKVFDIPLLGKRLVLATRWVKQRIMGVPLGYFGASTGGGAALWAAAELGDEISAVVSRGGRPDLAIDRLQEVSAPTLLLVGSHDEAVIEMNGLALTKLRHGKLSIVPGATHLFEEPGTLAQVAREAADWFLGNFSGLTKRDVA